MSNFPKTVIIIAGPTAVGKTGVAIALARHFNTAIISADSRQCFREMKIGVARPSVQELEAASHYFIASHSIKQEVSAATFEVYALDKVKELFREKEVVVMAGGTGLYIRAFCEGMDAIPEIPATIRAEILRNYEQHGLTWLQQQLLEKDSQAHLFKELQNPQRVMRALEVVMATGSSIQEFQKGNKVSRPFNIIKIGLTLPREQLYARINERVDVMMQEGLLEEVKQLLPYQQYNALQTVGYQELFEYLEGKHSLAEAVSLIKQNTRRYAKRQLTWFKKDEAYQWYEPSQVKTIVEDCQAKLPGSPGAA